MSSAADSVHEDKVSGKVFEWRLYRRFLPFARPYLGRFAASVVLLLLLSACSLAGPLLLRAATRLVLEPTTTEADTTARIGELGRYALYFLAIYAVTFLLRYSQLWLAAITGQRVIFDLRDHVFRHIQRRSLRFFDVNPVGRLVTRVTNDIENLAELFSSGIDVVFYDLIMLGLTLGLLFWISPSLALLVLALLPFVLGWSIWFKRDAQELFRRVRARVTRLNSFINESVTGIRVIQIFRTEERVNERFRSWDAELAEAHRGTVKNFSLFYPGVEMLSSLGAAVILIAGHRLFTGGSLEAADMLFFWFMLHKFFEPLREISEKYSVLQSAVASAERIGKILDQQESIADPENPVRRSREEIRGGIRLEDVHFSYDGQVEVLKGISFDVAPGEKIALVGQTGAGKSSIVSVIGRFYEVTSGRILLDGVDVREMDKVELARAVGVVPQEVFLFADTIRENLRLGDESLDDGRLREALRRVHAEEFVDSLPGGLDHPVQERGATFSQGQRQLLAFARTLAHDPPVLVLDEATANIDTATEQIIQRALENLMQGRTVLVVAHRLSTIKKSDRILVMHHGELREIGTHAELLRKDGLYRRLYELQYRGQDDSNGNDANRTTEGAWHRSS